MSTIRLERTRFYIATQRHIAAIKETYYATSSSFPLHKLILLNQEMPNVHKTYPDQQQMPVLNHFRLLLNSSQRQVFESTIIPKTSAVLVQGPSGTGKFFTLALIAIAYTLILHVKCLIVTPTNNAANEITDKIQSFWNSAKPPPCKGPPNIIR